MAKNKQLSNVQDVRSKNNPQLTLQQEQRLYKLHEEKHIGAFDKYKSCENVVVFGNPGCGRSTVINSLLGRNLQAFEGPYNQLLVEVVDPKQPQLKISHDCNPGQETLTSTQAEDGTTIWECTGLYNWVGTTKGVEDVGSPIEEAMKMRESPRVMQLLKTVKSVKFILVAAYHDLTVSGNRGENFLATVNRVASIFSNLDIIQKSILLVITKAPSDRGTENIVNMIKETIKYRDMSEHTKILMEYLTKSPIHIFYTPEKEGELEGPSLELIKNLPSCDVTESIQYPSLSPINQELALEILAKDDDIRIQQEEEAKAREELEKAGVNTKNISNAGFFIKVVDFLYDILSNMSILNKAGQYAGGVLMTLSSLIDINKLKGYFSSNKMEAVSEQDYSLQPMSPEKIRLAKRLVKMLNENEALSKEFNQKFNECIEQYTNCKNDEEKQSIVKQFSEWIISETNLKNELLAFEEAEPHISDESYNSSKKDSLDDENGGQNPVPGPDQNADKKPIDDGIKGLELSDIPNKLGQAEGDAESNDPEAREQGSNPIQGQKDSGQSNSSETESNNNDSLLTTHGEGDKKSNNPLEDILEDILEGINAPSEEVQEGFYDFLGNLKQQFDPLG